MDGSSLKNHFLIAMPSLNDPNFSRSVTLVCEHDAQGAVGVVINHPTGLTLADLFEQLKIDNAPTELGRTPVMAGGPVNPENGFILHRPLGEWDASLAINDEIGLTTSVVILQALADNRGPDKVIVALGYAGWSAGQLEQELAANAWLAHPADHDMLLDTPPDEPWNAAANAMGVDLSRLSSDAGHA
jgi:putative transcriptional regulator